MKPRKQTEGLLLITLVLCATFSSGLTRNVPPKSNAISRQQRSPLHRIEKRQSDGINALVDLALRFAPIIFNAFFSGEGGGSGPQTTDRIEEIDVKNEDPFAWPNLLSMGIKIALQLFSSATSGGIDKADVSPTQAILGTVISAMTGSEDPSEVATMAKQASEVINLMVTLVEALQTSFSS